MILPGQEGKTYDGYLQKRAGGWGDAWDIARNFFMKWNAWLYRTKRKENKKEEAGASGEALKAGSHPLRNGRSTWPWACRQGLRSNCSAHLPGLTCIVVLSAWISYPIVSSKLCGLPLKPVYRECFLFLLCFWVGRNSFQQSAPNTPPLGTRGASFSAPACCSLAVSGQWGFNVTFMHIKIVLRLGISLHPNCVWGLPWVVYSVVKGPEKLSAHCPWVSSW